MAGKKKAKKSASKAKPAAKRKGAIDDREVDRVAGGASEFTFTRPVDKPTSNL
jgi:hypothetical protein